MRLWKILMGWANTPQPYPFPRNPPPKKNKQNTGRREAGEGDSVCLLWGQSLASPTGIMPSWNPCPWHRMLRGLPHQSHGEEKDSSERLNFQVTLQPKHSRPSHKPQGCKPFCETSWVMRELHSYIRIISFPWTEWSVRSWSHHFKSVQVWAFGHLCF